MSAKPSPHVPPLRGLDAEAALADAQASAYGAAATLEMDSRRHDERLSAIAAAATAASGAAWAGRRGPLGADELRAGFAECLAEIKAAVATLRVLGVPAPIDLDLAPRESRS